MKKDSHRNNLLSSETKENSNKVTNDLNSESFKIDQLRDFYLQNQWSLKTNSELLTIIDPIPTHKTIFQSFIPNSYIWISSENDLKDVWHNIASAKVLGF